MKIDWDWLSGASVRDRQAWLTAHQPNNIEDRANWWRAVLTTPVTHACAPGSSSEVARWAALFEELVILLEGQEVPFGRDEMLTSRAYVAVSARRALPTGETTRRLDLPRIAQEVIDRIGNPPQDLVEPNDWKRLPLDEIRDLGRARNLLRPLRDQRIPLGDHRGVQSTLSKWFEVYRYLP